MDRIWGAVLAGREEAGVLDFHLTLDARHYETRAMKQAKTAKAKAKKKPVRKSSTGGATTSAAKDWRVKRLARIRALIKGADPEIAEEVKWRKPSNPAGVPVWERGGMICTGETYKDYVKLTFANGALLKDPAKLFNASLEGNQRRAIDIREGDKLDEKAFKALVRAAADLNAAKAARKK
jgi:hypothetical protein